MVTDRLKGNPYAWAMDQVAEKEAALGEAEATLQDLRARHERLLRAPEAGGGTQSPPDGADLAREIAAQREVIARLRAERAVWEKQAESFR